MHPHRSSASSTGAVSRPPTHPSRSATRSPMRAATQVPGALVGQEATVAVSVWVGAQRWFRFGDELVDLYPGSGAVAAGLSGATRPLGKPRRPETPAARTSVRAHLARSGATG